MNNFNDATRTLTNFTTGETQTVAEAPAPLTVITDAFGVVIAKGDMIAFAVRKQSNMWLNKLRVTGVTMTSVKGYDPLDTTQRNKTLRQTKTIVVIEKAESN
jgi:transketolase C-terminal domain/subunit